MRSSRLPEAGVLLLCLSSPASSRTWTVGGPGADFTEIRAAARRAEHGDLILVNPGMYQAFELSVGATVKAVSSPFMAPSVWIHGIVAGQRAAVSGMILEAGPTAGWSALIQDCEGEVLLESVEVRDPFGFERTRLFVADTLSLTITDMRMQAGGTVFGIAHASVWLERSRVRMSEIEIEGIQGVGGGSGFDGERGGPAIKLVDSHLVLSRPRIRGGKGGDIDFGCGFQGIAGDGGPGILAQGSDVIVLGSGDDYVEGGAGGNSGRCDNYFAGDGGAGYDGDRGLVSRVRVSGGEAGQGPFGDDGPEVIGQLTRDDRLPSLTMSGPLQQGSRPSILVHASAQALVIPVLSDTSTDRSAPELLGPPVAVMRGGLYRRLPAVLTQPDGNTLISFHLPQATELDGFPLHVQALVLPQGGPPMITNASSRIVGASVQAATP